MYVAIGLTKTSPGHSSQSRHLLDKNISASGKTSTEEGNKRFPTLEGELIFNPLFHDGDKMHVLKTHRDFRSNTLANCLVSNIILPIDDEKLRMIICSELNQFYGGFEYKVCNIPLVFDLIMLYLSDFLYEQSITA